MDEWTLCYDGYDAAEERLREALCTVGNGYVATRGAAPEMTADRIHYPGTYAAGIYNRRSSEIVGRTIENESLVNLPNWLPLTFRIDGGSWFDVDAADLLDYQQCLDLRRAVLTRRFRFRDEVGRTTAVTQRRFVAMHLSHVCALETTVSAEDWSGRLEFRSAVDGRVGNTLVTRYRDLAADHLEEPQTTPIADDAVLLHTQTNQSKIRIALAARNTLWREDMPIPVERRVVQGPGWIGHDMHVDLDAGQAVTLEKVVTIFTGRDRAISEPAFEAARWLSRLDRFEALLEGHVLAWAQLWERFHVRLDGQGEELRIVRLHLLHILQTVSLNTVDLDAGVPARGLHGEAYRGHVFWDELFIFPALNLRLPAVTRSLLHYRHRRLPEARHAAREAGYEGAMYPWESGSDGREEAQQFHLNPRSGRWLPDVSHRQRHIGLAIAYNVWQYLQVTDDREFLEQYGAEMLVEIARFWASIASYDPARDRYVIRGVMGPDEFHTGYPGAEYDGIDNNAYTNVMAVWLLLRAMDALTMLPARTRRELEATLGLRAEELTRWEDISRKMFVPFHGDGIISQFEGYADLEELDWDAYRARYGNIRRLDRLLEAEGDSVNRYQASKQADVLMLFYLLSADELGELLDRLGYKLDRDAIPRTIDYYMARTSHGSTLSAVVHAWVLARAHRDRAMEFFTEALEVDVRDVQGGTTPEGVHLAAMAGTIDLLQRCYAGLEMRGNRLVLNPCWAAEPLGALELGIVYRGHPLLLTVRGRTVEVRDNGGGHRPIEVMWQDELAILEPGSTVRFPP